ncbi:MAG: hypothetical protein AAF433_02445 [Bacteroidota bacterium]
MSDRTWRNNIIRFGVLLLLQVFLFQQVNWGWGEEDVLFIYIYPLFILMLPIQMFRPFVIALGFLMGLGVDLFYDTLGMHAAAGTFAAYLRPAIFNMVRPMNGYNIKFGPVPQDLGWPWFLRVLLLLLALDLFIFFGAQAFAPQFIGQVLLKTAVSLPPSFLMISLGVLIFNPKA